MEKKTVARQYYLDWVRVMVILSVFVYHSLRFFVLEDWHVKNSITYWHVELLGRAITLWLMPLCFVVSGAAVFYALGKGSAGGFIKDKSLRLFVPLLVGILTHSAWQVYLERITHAQFNGSFFDFYPQYFDGAYGFGGNFGWMGIHLWYLEMLFVFSLFFLPLFWFLKRGWGQRLLTGLDKILAVPGVVFFFLFLPITFIFAFVDGDSFLGMDVFGGWGILSHAWFFVSGFVIASSERLQGSIQRLRWVWLIGAIVLTTVQVAVVIPSARTLSYGLENKELMAYLWILTFLGWARQRLNFSVPRLQRANEGVLPFYILHQPVLLTIGYFVVQWSIPDPLKYIAIAGSSFVTIIVLYEFLVRRHNVLRFLCGMKLQPKAVIVRAPEALPAN